MTRVRQLAPIVAPHGASRYHAAVAHLLNADLLYGARLARVEALLDELVAANLDLARAGCFVDDALRRVRGALAEERAELAEELRAQALDDTSPGQRAWDAFEALSEKRQDHEWAEVAA